MKKFRKPRCPHCGYKIGLIKTWALKTQGEYLCPKCGRVSNIVLDRLVYLFAFLAILVSAIFFTLGFIEILPLDVWLLLLILLPFLLFYLSSVFLVRLKKPAVRRKAIPKRGRTDAGTRKTHAGNAAHRH
ncbi:MAG: Cxxc_20_cxxc protein [Oscillospiraceae bacterium]|jgi:uncharacterized protein (DUF983 family)